MSSQALVFKFGTDVSGAQKSLAQFAGQAATSLATVATVAVATSKTIRTEMLSSTADMAGAVGKQVATLNNLKTAASVAREAMKVGFAIHHPVLALGMQLLGNYKYALGGIAVGAIAAAEAIKIVTASFERVTDIIDKSEKIGVSATMFQVWTQQAEKTRLTVEQMEKALSHAAGAVRPKFDEAGNTDINRFMRLADELQNGRGFPTQSYQAFKDAGEDMDKLVQAAALLVTDLQSAAQKTGDMRLAALATQTAIELWGEGGRSLAQALEQGKISVADLAQKSRELGTIYSNDIVRQVDEVNQKYKEANEHLSREMQPHMETLVSTAARLKGVWADIVGLMAGAMRTLNDPGSVMSAYGTKDWGAALLGNRTLTGAYGGLSPVVGGDAAAAAALREAYLRQQGRDDAPVANPNAPQPPRRPSLRDLARSSDAPRETKARDTSEAADEVERLIKSMEKQNAALAGEAAAIGKSNIEREKSIALSKAEEAAKERGEALTDQERQKIEQLAQAHAELSKKIDDAAAAKRRQEEAQRQFGDIAYSAVDSLIIQHKKLGDVLKDVLRQFEQMALKALLLGSGPFGGLFGGGGSGGGGIFGALMGLFSGHADGGVAGYGTPTLAPVSAFRNAPHFASGGGIPAILHAGEIVLNAAQQKNVADNMKGGAPPVVVHNHAAGVQVQSYVTRGELRLHIVGALNAFAQDLPNQMASAEKRAQY